jgi:hypothetical protein
MPKENNAFDFETISDVILHLKYTAREGGDPLRQAARQALASDPQDDLVRLFSARHEFPNEWHGFLNPAADSAQGLSMALNLTLERFPYQFRGKTISISKVELFLKFKDVHDPKIYSQSQDGAPLGDYASGNPLRISLKPPVGDSVPAQLKSDKSAFSGLPHADLTDFKDNPAPTLGAWMILVQDADLAALPPSLRSDGGAGKVSRLNPGAVADMFVAFHYSVA